MNTTNKFFTTAVFDIQEEKQIFLNHIKELKQYSVEEITLYKKWKEISQNYNSVKDIETFSLLESKIWKSTDIYNKEQTIKEISDLQPELLFVEPDTQNFIDWKYLRIMCSSFEMTQNKGRSIKILIRDKETQKYLGICSLGSDVSSIKVRDDFIGWTKDNRFIDKKINHIASATTIVPTQPFGYNFLGGKLLASLLCIDEVRRYWETKYTDKLVGITTTSLYGSHSMYQRIPYWKELGKTSGKMLIKPDDDVYKKWTEYLRTHHRTEYDVLMSRTGPKQQILNFIYKLIDQRNIDYFHGFKRGVYFTELYENSKDFLCGHIEQDKLLLNPKLNDDITGVLNWWKQKSINRYINLLENNRLNNNILSYKKISQMSWDDVKRHYIAP